MNTYFKYTLPLIACFILTVNCHQTESNTKQATFKKVEKPTTLNTIDSLKFKAEIYRLDTLFQKLYQTNAFNGNVLIAKGNAIMYKKSFGVGVKETNIALTDSSLFQLASVSKVITSLAVLVLYEQQKLTLETQVADILTGFPYKNITIKHLLSHRSGLPNYTYFCNEYTEAKKPNLSNQDVLDIMIKYKPKPYFTQGLRFNYSNTNYALLALVIEKLSHQSFANFLDTALLKPLGMAHTTIYEKIDSHSKSLTYGYTMGFKKVAQDKFDGVYGDKGIYTTTHDLFLLSSALYQKTLLSKQTQELAFQPHSPEKKLSNYGLGWRMKDFDSDNKEIFHNGWWHGYRTSFHRRLKDSLTVIVLSNRLNKSVYSTWRIYQAIDGNVMCKTEDEE